MGIVSKYKMEHPSEKNAYSEHLAPPLGVGWV